MKTKDETHWTWAGEGGRLGTGYGDGLHFEDGIGFEIGTGRGHGGYVQYNYCDENDEGRGIGSPHGQNDSTGSGAGVRFTGFEDTRGFG